MPKYARAGALARRGATLKKDWSPATMSRQRFSGKANT
jgi:hypothetical protein